MSILQEPALASFLQKHSNHKSGPPPGAVFDCDGTVIRGDVGEAMFYFQIEHFLFRQSPADIWDDHPKREILQGLYTRLKDLPGDLRRTEGDFDAFAEILLTWYFGQIDSGEVIKACADIVRLFAGYTLPEVRAIARDTFESEIHAPLGTRRLGGRSVPQGIRYIKESVELLSELQSRGFTIWPVSGSNRWSVESVFQRLGLAEDRVIGIDLVSKNGAFTSKAIDPIPIRQGKIDALKARTERAPLLVASDSKNDIPLFLYSAGLKVRINSRGRDTADFFRSAGVSPDASWVNVEEPHTIG